MKAINFITTRLHYGQFRVVLLSSITYYWHVYTDAFAFIWVIISYISIFNHREEHSIGVSNLHLKTWNSSRWKCKFQTRDSNKLTTSIKCIDSRIASFFLKNKNIGLDKIELYGNNHNKTKFSYKLRQRHVALLVQPELRNCSVWLRSMRIVHFIHNPKTNRSWLWVITTLTIIRKIINKSKLVYFFLMNLLVCEVG